MAGKITLALVDDHVLVRKGFHALLKEFEDIEVIMEASNGIELIDQLAFKQPDVILLDIEMPFMNGCQTADILKERYPHIKIIILTMHKDEFHLIDLMERGANGFLQKDVNIDIIISAIHEVVKNEYYFDKHVSATLAKKIVDAKRHPQIHQPDQLSDRELEIVKLICEENSNKEIAEKMFLSHRTIDSYREKIMQKIGAKNTAGVVIYALKHDLLKKE
ncbi:MAG: response regulator transcription factor [Bacteroidota bacterium]